MKQTQIPMNVKVLFVSLIAGLLILSSGCKYQDGPFLSLLSREARIANVWKVAAATDENGDDATGDFDNWTYTFNEDGTATLTYTLTVLGSTQDINLNGDWNLVDNDANLQILLEDVTGLITVNEEYLITRLTDNELWLQDKTDELATLQLESSL